MPLKASSVRAVWLASLAVLIFAPATARAEGCDPPLFCTWNGSNGDWSNPANWLNCGDGDCVPGAEDTAIINGGTVNLDGDITIGSLRLNGGLIQGGNLTILEDGVWTGGTISGPGTLVIPIGAYMTMRPSAVGSDPRRIARSNSTTSACWRSSPAG